MYNIVYVGRLPKQGRLKAQFHLTSIYRERSYLVFLLPVILLLSFSFTPFDNAFAADPTLHTDGEQQVGPSDTATSTITLTDVVTPANANRLIVVGVGIDNTESDNVTVTSVVFGPAGTACTVTENFTAVSNSVSTNTFVRNQIFTLVNPTASQTCNVVVTLSGNVGDIGGILGADSSAVAVYQVLSNVDQTNPINPSFTRTASGDSTTPTTTVTTLADHMLFDIFSTSEAGTGVNIPTVGAGQSNPPIVAFRFSPESTFGSTTDFAAGSSTQASGGDGIMSWTLNVAYEWAISAIAIRSADLPALASGSSSEENEASNESDCDEDCTPPTLGVNDAGRRIVVDGFSYNGQITDVELYYTPFPLITVNVGEENLAQLKVFEDSGPYELQHVSLAFGLGKDESFSESNAQINVDFKNGGPPVVSTHDPFNVLENIKVETSIVDCIDEDISLCTLVEIYHTFRGPLEFNMVATNVWDIHRNGWQNFYNHGIHIEGDSLNPPNTTLVAFGELHMRGLFELTQVDPFDDIWVDEFGSVYIDKGNHRFDRISTYVVEQERDSLTSHGCDRTCNWFTDYKMEQIMKAESTLKTILQNKDIHNDFDNTIIVPVHTVSNTSTADDEADFQLLLDAEMTKSTQLYNDLYADSEKPIHNFDNTIIVPVHTVSNTSTADDEADFQLLLDAEMTKSTQLYNDLYADYEKPIHNFD